MPYLVKDAKLEAGLKEVMQRPAFLAVCERYKTMLTRLGNVDGNEIVALVILAIENK